MKLKLKLKPISYTFYQLWSDSDPQNIYIGSTPTQRFIKRGSEHFSNARGGNRDSGYKVYEHLRRFPQSSWRYEAIDEAECPNKDEAKRWEQNLIESEGATLNVKPAWVHPFFRTKDSNPYRYHCVPCGFHHGVKTHWERHLKTEKHKKICG